VSTGFRALSRGRERSVTSNGSVTPAVAPPPGSPRFPLLDSLRAAAALAVLFGHVAGATHITNMYWWGPLAANGDQGVTVFFILSGFLLYRPLVSAQLGGTPRSPWRDYTRRRLLRIVPAYWLALTVLAIYPGLPGVFTSHWWYYYFFLQVYNHNLSIGGIVVAWSLCVEVSFYLLLPFYSALVGRLGAGPRRVRMELGILTALGVGSLVLRYFDSGFPITLPIYLQWFSLGMGLALISAGRSAGRSHRRGSWAIDVITKRPWLCWAGALATYVALSFMLGKPPYAGYSNLQEVLVNRLLGGVAALLLVLPAVFGDTAGGGPRRIMASPLLAWLGLISYGIYLWHLTLLEVIAGHVAVHGNSGTVAFVALAILTAGAAATVAAASYYVVERPLLRFKRYSRTPPVSSGRTPSAPNSRRQGPG